MSFKQSEALKALMLNPNAIPTPGMRAGSPRLSGRNNSGSSARSGSKKKKLQQAATIHIGRLDPERDAEENMGNMMTSADKRRNFSSENRKAATETFHIIEPQVRENRWDYYQGENAEQLEEEHKRDEA